MEDLDLRSIAEARRLLLAASRAAPALAALSQEAIDAVVDAIHAAAVPRAEEWARMAVEETGFGNVPDKIAKNLFASVDVHRHIRPMATVGVLSRDDESRLVEIAAPAGVVAAIIPSTNPTSTAINKILIALKAACPIVVSPHPAAKRCVAAVCSVLAEAARAAGAPEGSLGWMTEVALPGTRELMQHRLTRVILATGGTGLVRAAYSSGKPAFGVGPGNVPAYVDRSADVAKAARDIVNGKCFDNGVLCSAENAVVADAPIADALRSAMIAEGARFLDAAETRRLSDLMVPPPGSLNTAVVGRSASVIAEMAGIDVPAGTRCLVAALDAVGPAAPLSREKLSPVLAFYAEEGWEKACQRCLEILEYGGMGHTMAIHARDRDLIMRFGLTKPVFRIVVNSPAAVGAVGLTTGVAPSMTLGCGALGGNITSDNITPRHLVNVKRLAFEIRPYERGAAPSPTPTLAARGPAPRAAGEAPATGSSSPPRAASTWPADALAPWPAEPPAAPVSRPSAPPPRSTLPVVASTSENAPAAAPRSAAPALATPSALTSAALRRRVEALLESRGAFSPRGEAPSEARARSAASAQPAQPAGEPPRSSPAAPPFVCEADVRQALLDRRKIAISRRTIVTPSARELGDTHHVFIEV